MGKFPGKPSKIVNRKRVKLSTCSSFQDNDAVKTAEKIYYGLAIFNETFGKEQETDFFGFSLPELKIALKIVNKEHKDNKLELLSYNDKFLESFKIELKNCTWTQAFRKKFRKKNCKQQCFDGGGSSSIKSNNGKSSPRKVAVTRLTNRSKTVKKNVVKKLLQKAKKTSNLVISPNTVDKLQDKGNANGAIRKFVLPSRSAHSSRVIKPNKRFLDTEEVGSDLCSGRSCNIQLKKPKLVLNSDVNVHEQSINDNNEDIHKKNGCTDSPNMDVNMRDKFLAFTDYKVSDSNTNYPLFCNSLDDLIVEGKRRWKPSYKVQVKLRELNVFGAGTSRPLKRTLGSNSKSNSSLQSSSDKESSQSSDTTTDHHKLNEETEYRPKDKCTKGTKWSSPTLNGGKVILRKARLKLNTQTSAGTDGPFTNSFSGNGNSSTPGTVVCGVCGAVRFYRFVKQARKFGIFSCESCRKFISKMMKRQASFKTGNASVLECFNGEGNCSVPPIVRSQQWKPSRRMMLRCAYKARCQACWLKMCLRSFNMNDILRTKLSAMLPLALRKGVALNTTEAPHASSPQKSPLIAESQVKVRRKAALKSLDKMKSGNVIGTNTEKNDSKKANKTSHQRTKILKKVTKILSRSKDNAMDNHSKSKTLDHSKSITSEHSKKKSKGVGVKVKKKGSQRTPGSDENRRQRLDLKGPRVKHVCRSASIVLGQPQAIFPTENTISPKKSIKSAQGSTKSLSKKCSQESKGPIKSQDLGSDTPEVRMSDTSVPVLKCVPESKPVPSIDFSKPAEETAAPVVAPSRKTNKQTPAPPVPVGLPVVRSLLIPGKRDSADTPNIVSIDFWESYDPDEVCNTGFSLIGSEPFHVRAMCFLCGSAGHETLVHCALCCEPYHQYCIEEFPSCKEGIKTGEWRVDWVCHRCTVCSSCGRGLGQQLCCQRCHKSYHVECIGVDRLSRRLHSPDRPWVCSGCLRCKSCGVVDVSHFVGNLPLCKTCFKLRQKGNFCPLCQKCYDDNDYDTKMMECGQCKCWVHAKCEGLSDEKYQVLSFLPESVEFVCRMCCVIPPAPWWLTVEEELKAGYLGVLKSLSKNKKACAMLKWSPKKQCSCKSVFIGKKPRLSELEGLFEPATPLCGKLVKQDEHAKPDESLSIPSTGTLGTDKPTPLKVETTPDLLAPIDTNLPKTLNDSAINTDVELPLTYIPEVMNVEHKASEGDLALKSGQTPEAVDTVRQDVVSLGDNTQGQDTDPEQNVNNLKQDVVPTEDNMLKNDPVSGVSLELKQDVDPEEGDRLRHLRSRFQIRECSVRVENCVPKPRSSATFKLGEPDPESSPKLIAELVVPVVESLPGDSGLGNTEGELKSITSIKEDSKENSKKLEKLSEGGKSPTQKLKEVSEDSENSSQISQKHSEDSTKVSQESKELSEDSKKTNQTSQVHSEDGSGLSQKSEEVNEDNSELIEGSKLPNNGVNASNQNSQNVSEEYEKSSEILKVIEGVDCLDPRLCISHCSIYMSCNCRELQGRAKQYPTLLSIKRKVNTNAYSSLLQFHHEMEHLLCSSQSGDLLDVYHRTLQEVFPWFDPKNACVSGTRKEESVLRSILELSPTKIMNPDPPSLPREVPHYMLGHSQDYYYGRPSVSDFRVCTFCKTTGDGRPSEEGRLLYCGQNEWTHANCALWSAEVFEEIDGSLQNVHAAMSRGRQIRCWLCDKRGASVGCCARNCNETFHFPCARQIGCAFMDDKTVFCLGHIEDAEGKALQQASDFTLRRPIYVELDRKRKKYVEPGQVRVTIGSLVVESLGELVSVTSDHGDTLVPTEYTCSRLYWSSIEPWRLVQYRLRARVHIPRPEPAIDLGHNITIAHCDETAVVRQVVDQLLDAVCSREVDEPTPADLLPPELEDAIFEDLPRDLLDGISMQDIFPKLWDPDPTDDMFHTRLLRRNKSDVMPSRGHQQRPCSLTWNSPAKRRKGDHRLQELVSLVTPGIAPTAAEGVRQLKCRLDEEDQAADVVADEGKENIVWHSKARILQVDGTVDSSSNEGNSPPRPHKVDSILQLNGNIDCSSSEDNSPPRPHEAESILQLDGNVDCSSCSSSEGNSPPRHHDFDSILQLDGIVDCSSCSSSEGKSPPRQHDVDSDILQLDGTVDSNGSDDNSLRQEDEESLPSKLSVCMEPAEEEPVSCDRCRRTYRTRISFERHRTTCSNDFSLSTSESDSENARSSEEESTTRHASPVLPQQPAPAVVQQHSLALVKAKPRARPAASGRPKAKSPRTYTRAVRKNNPQVQPPLVQPSPAVIMQQVPSANMMPAYVEAFQQQTGQSLQYIATINTHSNSYSPAFQLQPPAESYMLPLAAPQPAVLGTIIQPVLGSTPALEMFTDQAGGMYLSQPMYYGLETIVSNTVMQSSQFVSGVGSFSATTTQVFQASKLEPIVDVPSGYVIVNPTAPLSDPTLTCTSNPIPMNSPTWRYNGYNSSDTFVTLNEPLPPHQVPQQSVRPSCTVNPHRVVQFNNLPNTTHLHTNPNPQCYSNTSKVKARHVVPNQSRTNNPGNVGNVNPSPVPRPLTKIIPELQVKKSQNLKLEVKEVPNSRHNLDSHPYIKNSISNPTGMGLVLQSQEMNSKSVSLNSKATSTLKRPPSPMPNTINKVAKVKPCVVLNNEIAKATAIQEPLKTKAKVTNGSTLNKQNEIVVTCRDNNSTNITYEVHSQDGFSCTSNSVTEVWQKVFEAVQEARKTHNMAPLPENPFGTTVSGLQMLGLKHNALRYLLEQLPGVGKCIKYKPRYHKLKSQGSREKEEEALFRENVTGCTRSEPFLARSPYDMFGWLASRHRQPPKFWIPNDGESTTSNRRATSSNLPMAMRFRHLKTTSKEAVGVYRSHIHGRGLFCLRDIEVGEMVIEYAGEVIRSLLTDKREKYYESKGIGCYMFRIDDTIVVDATMRGNAARFINHSCDPNCYSRVVDILGMKHILIFALRRITQGEELTYDYKFPFEDDKIPCTCGSRKCRKYLN